MTRLLMAFTLATLTTACGGDEDCKNACDVVNACDLSSSGLSCDSSCKDDDATCAACINETECADLAAGACASDCPNASLSR